jgi:hemolysin activation/secretion protein
MDAKYILNAALLSPFSVLIASTAFGQVNPIQIPPVEKPVESLPTILPEQQNPFTPTNPVPPVPTVPNPQETSEDRINVIGYSIEGSTVFSQEELADITAPFIGIVSFQKIQEARAAIDKHYEDAGYFTTGAYIPAGQVLSIDGAVVKIKVVEGRLQNIVVTGTQRLDPNYIKSRLGLFTQQPLNRNQLLEGLRILQQDPLLESISAELSAGSQNGTNILEIKVKEKNPFTAEIATNNNRPPSVGSWQRRIQITQANLYGIGDRLTGAFGSTESSFNIDASYTVPLSPYNTALTFNTGGGESTIVEEPYRSLFNLHSSSRYYEVSLRHPLLTKASGNTLQELAIGLTATRADSQISGNTPFPISLLSPGSNENGTTSVTAIRFFQEYVQRNSRSVVALRSQFNVGIGALDSTINERGPDSRFFSWQGQGRWVQRLEANTDLVFQGRVQLADRPLLGLEQFSLGGQSTVRGYRQDAVTADNGLFASMELQIPIAGTADDLLQIAPFLDYGYAWNSVASATTLPNETLLSVGLGLQWRTPSFAARIDYGIPLVSNISSRRNTLQENGLYFSLRFFPF